MTVPWKMDSTHYQHNGLKMIFQTRGYRQSLRHLSERSQTLPQVRIAKDYFHVLFTTESLAHRCVPEPHTVPGTLAHHVTSISKGFLNEVMTKEQLTFSVLLQLVPRPAEPILNPLILKTWLQTLVPGLRQEN